jgi:hypothetical protein
MVTESKPKGNNVKNVRRETSGIFRNKKRKYLKEKKNKLETNTKVKLFLCLTKYYALKIYGDLRYSSTHS